ncbi:MAG: uroporphyrinogen-III C-methyltransferase [Acidimicrobiales bacterium]
MTVYLVGAGPGDPELLTLKAARLISSADAVVYDRLVHPDVIRMAPPWAECFDVGKTPGLLSPTQGEINDLLVSLGGRFETVVRIKGGDPFVFGRGAEEADDLLAAGVPVSVVPGISSAIAGPAAAGLSVTRRGVASGFCVVTAHQDDASRPIHWPSIATAGITIVVLMGAKRAPIIRRELIAGGLEPATPVAIITDATGDGEQIALLTLAELGRSTVPNPSIIMIGPAAAERLSVLAGVEIGVQAAPV